MALLVVLLVAIPIFEVWLLIQVGQAIGVWWTVSILVAGALLAAWLMRREGDRAWKALTNTFSTGKVPSGELAEAALILVGGILLMLPGFATDVVGFLFLLPWTRPFARKLIAFFVARRMSRLGIPVAYARADRSNLIPGETVSDPAPSSNGKSGSPVVIAGEVEEAR